MIVRFRVHVFGPLRVFDEHGTEHIPTLEAERTLLLFLALHGRRVHVEQAMEALWPGMAPSEGRMLLRKLLYRLRTLYGPLVVREGDTLVLRADTALADYEAALATLAAYRNLQLAPDVRYADWAESAGRRIASVGPKCCRS